MPPIRIIPRLDIKGPNVIKGIHLEGLRVVGTPGHMAQKYYAAGADEIVLMDVVASLYGRNTIIGTVESAARDIFVPMTVGGGIRTLEDIVAVLRSGADKVAINTAATRRPNFLREAAHAFGSQCIVLSVEAKAREAGKWELLTDNGRETTGRDVLDWVAEAEGLGIGEVLVTSVDREGTRQGYDVKLIEAVQSRVRVPVIACGGAGNPEHVSAMLDQVHVEAVCCSSIFHYGECTIGDLKRHLATHGQDVRL